MHWRKSSILAAMFIVGFTSWNAFAQTADEVRAHCKAEGRPCVGLVLSGGGARGFAHVGVIKVIEELGIKIDVVTGTSMGSMVGGAYAAGFSIDQLKDAVLGVDWDKMLAGSADRQVVPFRQKLDDYKSLPANGLEISADGTPTLPTAFVSSQELALFLNEKTSAVSMVEDLSMLSIPFAAPATDLVTGERVILQKDCTLGQAMRASMSVPGAFEPVQFHKYLLVDGGLVDNLPVELARSMGADVIIAVNVGTPLLERDELGNVVGVMAQMVNLLTEQNVQRSISSLREGDILITPDLAGYSSASLRQSAEIIERGEEAARKVIAELKKFSVSPEEWLAWNAAREEPFANAGLPRAHQIDDIRIAHRQHPAMPDDRIVAVADIDTQEPVNNAELDDAMRRVWGQGAFQSVTYHFDPGPRGMETLVIEPKEKRPGFSNVRLGGSIETNFDDDSTFNLLFAHDWHLPYDWSAVWRNEVQAGEEQHARSELFLPIAAGSFWFVQPSVEYSRTPYDVYDGDKRIAKRRNETLQTEVMFGREIDQYGYAGLRGGWMRTKSTHEIGLDDNRSSYSTPYMGGILFLDTLNNVNFPTKGFRVSLSGYLIKSDASAEDTQGNYLVDVLIPYSVGYWTATVNAQVGRSSIKNAFQLGGASHMTGSPYGRWSGSRLQYGRVSLARNVTGSVPMLTIPVWLGGSFEMGRAWNPSDPSSVESGEDNWRRSASIYLGLDTIIGPMFLGYGKTFGEDSTIYFRWGRRE